MPHDDNRPTLPNFLDEKDCRFTGLRGTRDTVSRLLRESGVGTLIKHAEVITECALWDEGLQGASTPRCRFYAIFFMNGKVLCLSR